MKIIKNNVKFITGFILGAIIFGGGVYAATLIDSKDVTYTPSDNSFEASNVESALDKLYDKIGNKFDMSNAELIYLGNAKNIMFSKDYSYVIVTGSWACGGSIGCTPGYITTATIPTGEYTNEYVLNEQNPPVKVFADVKKDSKLSVGAKFISNPDNYEYIHYLYVTVIGIP